MAVRYVTSDFLGVCWWKRKWGWRGPWFCMCWTRISGLNRAKRNVNFHGMGNYKNVDGDLAYLKCEKKVDSIFEWCSYSDVRKVKLEVIEFTNYGLIWWDQNVIGRRRNGERPIASWEEMKVLIRRKWGGNLCLTIIIGIYIWNYKVWIRVLSLMSITRKWRSRWFRAM